jgi:filamentous hemagglutinin family protein
MAPWVALLALAQDGGSLQSGVARIDRPAPDLTVIHQSSDKLILNWNSFSIDAGHTVRFDQPSPSSIALNRVVGGNPSVILGALQANGHVWLLNPNGILFGSSARVDVGSLLASTLSIGDAEFLAGRYRLVQEGPMSGVVNRGEIRATEAAVLAAPVVENSGTIAGGRVYMLATSEVVFDSGLVSYSMGTSGAGEVALPSEHVSDVLRAVVQTGGLVEAGSVVEEDGVVRLVGAEGAAVNTGTLRGSRVQIMGDDIAMMGHAAGSEVLIGGNYKGQGPEPNARRTYVGRDAEIEGDRVIVWADGRTQFYGSIRAQGGFVETSGKEFLEVEGATVIASEWLLDPADTNLTTFTANGSFSGGNPNIFTTTANSASADVATIVASLNAGTSVTINTTPGGTQAGNITVSSAIAKTAGGNTTLTLNAVGALVVNAPISSTVGAMPVVITAGGDITINESITTNNGAFTATSTGAGATFMLAATKSIAAGTGIVTIQVDNMDVLGNISGSGPKILRPNDPARTVTLGTEVAGTLSLTDAELDLVSGSLGIGYNTGSGSMNVTAAITRAVATQLTLFADMMDIGAAISIPSGFFIIRTQTAGRTITLGTEVAGTLSLMDAELDQISTGSADLAFGTTGALNVTAPISRPVSTSLNLGANTMEIGATINTAGGALIISKMTGGTTITLGAEVGGTLSLTDAELDLITAPTLTVRTGFGSTVNVAGAITRPAPTNIGIFADTINVAAGINSGGGSVDLLPESSGRAITLGTEVAGTLSLTDAELDLITAPVLRIGGTFFFGGNLSVTAPLTPANIATLSLSTPTGSTVSQAVAAATITVTSLRVSSSGAVTLDLGAHSVGNLAASVTGAGNGFSFAHAGALSIATVDSVAGITTNAGNVLLSAGGALTQSARILCSGLVITGAGSAALTNASNNATTLAANLTGPGGSLTYTDSNALTIGTVNGVIGVTTNGGTVSISTVAGALTVNNTVAAGAAAVNLTAGGAGNMIDNNAAITGNAATLRADRMDLTGGTVNVGAGRVTLRSDAAGRAIDLGSATDAAAALELSDPELDTITTTGVLQIGEGTAGAINISTAIDAANISTLTLINNSSVSQAASIVETNLRVSSAGPVTLTNAGNAVTVLSGLAGTLGNAFAYSDSNSLTIGTVDTQPGITTNEGLLTITAIAGNLTVNSTVTSAPILNGALVQLTAGGAGNTLTNNDQIHGSSIILRADRMILAGSAVLAVGGGRVTLRSDAAGRVIDLGSATDAAAALELSDAELDTITTTGVLQIGEATAGTIIITSPIDTLNVSTMTLWTDASVLQTTGTITETNLRLQTRLGVNLDVLANNVTTLSAAATGAGAQSIEFTDADALTIGTVDTLAGLTANGVIAVNTVAGNLVINNAVATGGAVILTAGGAGNLLDNNAAVSFSLGTFQADRMNLIGGTLTGIGSVTLRSDAAGRSIDLGSATDAAAALELSDAELDTITGTSLQIGDAAAGAINITAAIDTMNVSLTHLWCNSTVGQAAGITEATLTVRAAGTVSLTDASNDVGNLAANVSGAGNAFSFTDSNSLTIVTASVTGVSSNGGTITVSTVAGALTVNAAGAAGAAAVNLTAGGAGNMLDNNAAITGNAATLRADRMDLVGGTVNAGAGVAALRPNAGGRAIDLGSATDVAAALELSDPELDTITAGVVRVGEATAGALTVTAAIAPLNTVTLSLISGGAVTQNPGMTITETNLQVTGASVAMLATNAVDTLAGRATGAGNPFSYTDPNALTIGTVDGVAGIATVNGVITVNTTGTLTVNSAVAAGAAAVNLTAAGAGNLLDNNAAITGNAATLRADRMNLVGGGSVNAGAGRVILRSNAAGRAINLGSATDAAAALELSDPELDTITTTGVLQIGESAAGTLNVSANIDTANVTTLSLINNSTMSQTGSIAEQNLAITARGVVSFDNIDNDVGTLAADLNGIYALTWIDANTLTIGTVDTRVGVYVDDLTLTIRAGNLTVNQPISNNDVASVMVITLSGAGALFDNNSSVDGGPITIVADRMDLVGGTITATNSIPQATLYPATAGWNIDLGSATDAAANTLELSDAELDTITVNAYLRIGFTGTGSITITSAINTASVPTLHLDAVGGSLTQTAAIAEQTLWLSAANNIVLTNAGNDVTTSLSGNVTNPGGQFAFTDANGLTIAPMLFTGVRTVDGPIIISTLNGNLTITNGFAAADVNAGTSTVTLSAGSSGNDRVLTINATANVTGTGGVTLIGDNINLAGTVTATGAVAHLRPFENNTLVNVGGAAADGANTLGLAGAELDAVTCGTLRVGHASSGALTVIAAVAPANTSTLSLFSGGAVTQNGGATITETNLQITGASIAMSATNPVTTLAGRVTGAGNFDYFDPDSLIIGTVDSVVGVSANGGNITILASAGNLTVNSAVTTTTTIALRAQGAGNTLDNNAAVSGGTGVSFAADRMTLSDGTVNGGTVRVFLDVVSFGRAIDLGSATDAAAALELSDAELDTIATTAFLQIGDAGAGAITITAPIDTAGVNTTYLWTGSSIGQSAGIVEGNLAIQSVGAVNLGLTTNDVGTLAASVTGAGSSFSYRDANALTIGTVTPTISGITTNGAAIQVITISGNLTVNNNVASGAAANLTVEGAGNMLDNNAAITGASSKLLADRMDLTGGTVNVGAGTVILLPLAARTIDIGSATDAAAALELSNAELNTVTAGLLIVGDPGAGGIAITSAVNWGGGASLLLWTGGTVTQTASLTETTLGIIAAGAVTLNNGLNDVTTLCANVTGAGAAFGFTDANDLAIGALGATVVGITTNNGSVRLTAGGAVQVSENVATSGGLFWSTSAGRFGVSGGRSVTTAGGFLLVRASDVGLTGTLSSAGGIVTLSPIAAGSPVNVSGADVLGEFSVSGGELSNITAGTLRIGSMASGNLRWRGPYAAVPTWNTLGLASGGTITQDPGATISVTNLRLTSVGSITLNEGNAVGDVSAITTTTGATFSFRNAAALRLRDVDHAGTEFAGIALTNTGGSNGMNVDIRTSLGNLTLVSRVRIGAGNVWLEATNGSLLDLNDVDETNRIDANGNVTLVAGAGQTIGTGAVDVDVRNNFTSLTTLVGTAPGIPGVNTWVTVAP